MKKWKQALALVLALVMALSLVALPSFAEGEETGGGTAATGGSSNTPGLELRKVYNPSTGLLTLEAYATGSTTTTTSTEPVDIILVLDVSGSMEDSIVSYTYTRCTKSTKTAPTTIRMPTASISRRITAVTVATGIRRNIMIIGFSEVTTAAPA